MNKNVLSLAAVLVISSTASADLLGWDIIASPNQHPDGLHDTWQVIMIFDNDLDRIAAIGGLPDKGANALHFHTGSGDMYNQGFLDGLSLQDSPTNHIGGESYDSWVTLGDTFDGNASFTPGFLGDDPSTQKILGSVFDEDDGAWFFNGAPLVVGDLEDAVEGDDLTEIVIAQFTVDKGVGFRLEGLVTWLGPASGVSTNFYVDNTPAPGALALLGLAGLAGTRRRRR